MLLRYSAEKIVNFSHIYANPPGFSQFPVRVTKSPRKKTTLDLFSKVGQDFNLNVSQIKSNLSQECRNWQFHRVK